MQTQQAKDEKAFVQKVVEAVHFFKANPSLVREGSNVAFVLELIAGDKAKMQ